MLRVLYYYFIDRNLHHMHTYTPQTFTLPELPGLSEKQIKSHLGLYEGYVKHINLLREQSKEL